MTKASRKAIYALSWDPITFGHIDMAKRIASLHDEVVIALGINRDKKYMFSLQERLKLTKQALSHILDNAEITAFRWLLVQYAYERNIPVTIRWVRNAADFEFESVLHKVGDSQNYNIETMLMLAKNDKWHISSSSAKALLKDHGQIHEYVPLNVKQALEARMLGQYPIGITGGIGCGKSFVAENLCKIGAKYGIPTTNIDLDKVAHEIYESDDEEIYQQTREKIIQEFGEDIRIGKNYISREKLGPKVFGNKERMQILNNILQQPIRNKIQRKLNGLKGLILINNALTAEFWLWYLSNNNVVLVSADEDAQKERLASRWHDEQEIQRRTGAQSNTRNKKVLLEDSIQKNHRGSVIDFDNTEKLSENERVSKYGEKLFRNIVNTVDIDGKLRRNGLAKRLDIKDPETLFRKMKADWDNEGRFYHDWDHYLDGLNKIYANRNVFSNPDTVELARSHHDSIMDFKKHDGSNEKDSARLLLKRSKEHGIDDLVAASASQYVERTDHQDRIENQDLDGLYMKDIDLSTLGNTPDNYQKYVENVFLEYKSIYTKQEFTIGRMMVMQKFLEKLEKNELYKTEHFQAQYTQQAKENIQKELEQLQTTLTQ